MKLEKSDNAPTSHGTDMDIFKVEYLLSLDLEQQLVISVFLIVHVQQTVVYSLIHIYAKANNVASL